MRTVTPKRFTELQFTSVLLSEFINNNIYEFSKDELEQDLYMYKQNPKYSSLFLDIDSRYERLNLSASITTMMIIGSIFSVEPNLDKKYIFKGYKADNKDEEKVGLIRDLVNEYKIRKECCKQNYKLKIYGLNNKNNYNLIRGKSTEGKIELNIITDASNIKEEETDFSNEFWCENPKNSNQLIRLEDANVQRVILDDYSFIIEQRKIDDKLVSSTIYTDILDTEKLGEIVSYCSLEESKVEKIKVLNLRK